MLTAFQKDLSHPRSPEWYPGWVVKPQTPEQSAFVSRERPRQAKTVSQGGVGCLQGHSGRLRQAEGRSSETLGNVGSLPRMSLPSHKHPVVSGWVEKPQALKQVVCVSHKKPPQEETRWRCNMVRLQGLGNNEAGRREKQRDSREGWEPPKENSPTPEALRGVPGKL